MSWFDTAMADTVGVAWRAATGTVDPWTKNNQVEQQTADMVQAGTDPAIAKSQANADVTTTLKSIKADPTDASAGTAATIAKLQNYIIIAVVIVAAIYLYGKHLEGGRR